MKEVEGADHGIQLGGGKEVGGMLFADDFVGVSGSKEGLQKLISVVHGYCNKWRLKANVHVCTVWLTRNLKHERRAQVLMLASQGVKPRENTRECSGALILALDGLLAQALMVPT